MTIKKIGTCDVDAGLLMIGDPCYHVGRESHEKWIEWINKNISWGQDRVCVELNHEKGQAGAGVCFSTDFGDGSYPVYQVGNGSAVVVTDSDWKLVAKDLRTLADQLEQRILEEEDEDDF